MMTVLVVAFGVLWLLLVVVVWACCVAAARADEHQARALAARDRAAGSRRP
jgi:hypothetical protein